MARTGRFGRLPRAAPNLTSTIVALIQEAAAQEDANIIKAWNEGGDIDGVKVTDSMLLAHITKRRDELSPTDPQYDYWDNLKSTYTFAIAESKMTLRYEQGGVNDAQMAGFYTTWANKLPRESEAYRDLMRSAAQFLDAAKRGAGGGGGGGGGGGRGRRGGGEGGGGGGISQSEYDARWNAALDKEANYDIATYVLLQAAYQENILLVRDRESGPDDLSRLNSGDEADHYNFIRLFDQIAQADPNDRRFGELQAMLVANGINPADFTYNNWVKWGDDKTTGVRARYEAAVAAGDTKTTINKIQDEYDEHVLQQSANHDIDEFAIYQRERANLEYDLQQSGLTPFEEAERLARHRRLLDDLFGRATDPETMGFLRGEMNQFDEPGRLGVGPTLREETEGGIRSVEDDAGFLGTVNAEVTARVDELNSGNSYMWLTQDPDGVPTYEIINKTDPALHNPELGTLTFAPTTAKGPAIGTFIQYFPIAAQAAALDPVSGRASVVVPSMTGDDNVGKYFVLNGVTYYGVYTGADTGGGPPDLKWFVGDTPFITDQFTIGPDGTMILTVPLDPTNVGVDADGNPMYDPDALISEQAGGLALGRGALNRTQIMELAFNPRSVISTMALDDDLPRTMAFDEVSEAIALTDPDFGRSLIRASNDQMWELAGFLDPVDPQAAYDDINGVRTNAVAVHNNGVTLARMEAAKYGLDPIEQEGFLARRTGGVEVDPETGEVTLTAPQREGVYGQRPLTEEEARLATVAEGEEAVESAARARRLSQSATFSMLRDQMTGEEIRQYHMTGNVPASVYARVNTLPSTRGPVVVAGAGKGQVAVGTTIPGQVGRGGAFGTMTPEQMSAFDGTATLKLPTLNMPGGEEARRGPQPMDDMPQKRVTPHLRPNAAPPPALVNKRTGKPIATPARRKAKPKTPTKGQQRAMAPEDVFKRPKPKPQIRTPKKRTYKKPKTPQQARYQIL